MMHIILLVTVKVLQISDTYFLIVTLVFLSYLSQEEYYVIDSHFDS